MEDNSKTSFAVQTQTGRQDVVTLMDSKINHFLRRTAQFGRFRVNVMLRWVGYVKRRDRGYTINMCCGWSGQVGEGPGGGGGGGGVPIINWKTYSQRCFLRKRQLNVSQCK